MKQLTIGMAVYDDFDGVYFTVQALRIYQGCNNQQFELIVVDNNPDSAHGKAIKHFIEGYANKNISARYVPYKDKTGTSTRNEIFRLAQGIYTLCLDCHVMLEPDGIKHLLQYYAQNPNTKNLIQGPLWDDSLQGYSTQFDPVWRDGMFGIWGSNHMAMLIGEPFEIPSQGLGLFSCKTSEWLGFNPLFRGFGGEEGYIHEKFRQNGAKCICLPNLKWNHRFGRPNGLPYTNDLKDRVWNYFVGWLEIYKDPNHPFIKSIYDHFSSRLTAEQLNSIYADAIQTL